MVDGTITDRLKLIEKKDKYHKFFIAFERLSVYLHNTEVIIFSSLITLAVFIIGAMAFGLGQGVILGFLVFISLAILKFFIHKIFLKNRIEEYNSFHKRWLKTFVSTEETASKIRSDSHKREKEEKRIKERKIKEETQRKENILYEKAQEIEKEESLDDELINELSDRVRKLGE